MSHIKQIFVDPMDVTLGNEYLENEISIKVELTSLWSKISKYTDVMVQVILTIPLIENGASKNMVLELEGSYKVDTLDKDNPYVTFSAEFSGEIDTGVGKEVTYITNVTNYNVL